MEENININTDYRDALIEGISVEILELLDEHIVSSDQYAMSSPEVTDLVNNIVRNVIPKYYPTYNLDLADFQHRFGMVMHNNSELALAKHNDPYIELRLALILEELIEIAEVLGSYNTTVFKNMLTQAVNRLGTDLNSNKIKETPNPIKLLRELCDLQYVLSGAVSAFGYLSIFDHAFAIVHKANMTKAHSTLEEAKETINYYNSQNIDCEVVPSDDVFIIKRFPDGKILKSPNYKFPDDEFNSLFGLTIGNYDKK